MYTCLLVCFTWNIQPRKFQARDRYVRSCVSPHTSGLCRLDEKERKKKIIIKNKKRTKCPQLIARIVIFFFTIFFSVNLNIRRPVSFHRYLFFFFKEIDVIGNETIGTRKFLSFSLNDHLHS